MNRIDGVAGVEKVASSSGDTQEVRVKERGNKVLLTLSANSYPAALTPEEARHIARALRQAAFRIDAQEKEKAP